jgi:hypothetical protein
LCAREELLPLPSDADEGCQWEVQTEEGCTLYWIIGLRAPMEDILFYGKENVLNLRETASVNSVISFEASFLASNLFYVTNT